MASLPGPVSSLADCPSSSHGNPAHLPELDDADYVVEVLQAPSVDEHASAQRELLEKAGELGLPLPDLTLGDAKRNTFSANSQHSTVNTYHHARTYSSDSYHSASTTLTSPSPAPGDATDSGASSPAMAMKRSKRPSFSQYDKYVADLGPNLNQPQFKPKPPPIPVDDSSRSIFSVSTRKSYISIKEGFRKIRLRKKPVVDLGRPIACICCRDDFDPSSTSYNLPCGHTYCGNCLRVMVQQSMKDEAKFPPRCCTQPITSSILKGLLNQKERHDFLKAARLYSTPWEARIFCPNTTCGEFIPPRNKLDPKHPFDVICRTCDTRVCVMCRQNAHPIGKECPDDWELNEVLKIGEKSGWRRCYKCRALVELAHGCSHITCRCKAQFCYLCGAIWSPSVGCPNYCDGFELLERRQEEEEARVAALEAEEAEEATQKAEAEKRTKESAEFAGSMSEMAQQRQRLLDFIGKKKWLMEARHSEKKQAMSEKYVDQVEKMQDRHAKTASHLEERQVEAEMELRATLKQAEKSVKIRLKHMEAYCDGLGRNSEAQVETTTLPPRVVTERDLRELGQQYNLRDDLARLHQSKINVLRDRQAKRMEELQDRQEQEMAKLVEKRDTDLTGLAGEFALEEEEMARVFERRKEQMRQHWKLRFDVLANSLEKEHGVRYATPAFPAWPNNADAEDPIISAAAAEADQEGDDDHVHLITAAFLTSTP